MLLFILSEWMKKNWIVIVMCYNEEHGMGEKTSCVELSWD